MSVTPADHTRLAFLGLPAADTLEDLSARMRFSKGLLFRLASQSERFYRVYKVPKKSGGERTITQPNRICKAVQAWILRNILDRLNVSEACKGFERGQNIRKNVQPHVNSNAVLTVDIEDFFPSIGVRRVHAVFRHAGYNPRMAGLLAALCTAYNCLPQGAPTSPRLANLVCSRLDRRLLGFAGKRGIIYTRYADDLSFSAAQPLVLAKSKPIIEKIVAAEGLQINERKVRLAGPARRRRITGLVLTGKDAGIGRAKYRYLRADLFHLAKQPRSDASNEKVRRLDGWLSYVRDVDMSRYARLTSYAASLSGKQPNSPIAQLAVIRHLQPPGSARRA
jgi:RNA-directed DNA polymerase